tara:strand:- start:43 stop:642 length:600 start_codon:yes stop_codon:yes gene_type:complete
MKKIISVLVLLSFVLINSNSFSYSSDPKIFISELANDAISTLSNKDISIVDKKKKIEIIALENVDINALSMYTLGEIRKTLPEDKIKEYKTLFTKYFLKSLTSRLIDYSNQNFEVLDADQKSEAYTIVNSRILKSSTQPEVKISWRVYTKNIEKPLIRDLIFEGLSLAKTQKEEFKSILSSNNNNIDILFFKLEEFIKK